MSDLGDSRWYRAEPTFEMPAECGTGLVARGSCNSFQWQLEARSYFLVHRSLNLISARSRL